MHEDKIFIERNASSQNVHEEITMTMVQTTYPSSIDKVDVTIKNNTSTKVYTGLDYSVEYYNGSVWGKIPLDFAAFNVSIALFPQQSREFSIYLCSEQYDYQPGRYRVCKTVSTTERTYDTERNDLTAEFTIK